MALVTRTQAFEALFRHLSNVPGFVSYSRQMILPTKVSLEDQPKLILATSGSNNLTRYRANHLPVDEWECAVVIYFMNDDENVPGWTIIEPLVQGVRNALIPDNLEEFVQSLGLDQNGLWCRVDGRWTVETGDTDPRRVGGAVIPIKITVGMAELGLS